MGQRARVGGGPHWAGLDLGVQVSLHLSGLSKSYHLICRPDHWANAAMFSWGGVTYTITPQLVICILDIIIAEKLLGLPKRNNVLIVLLYAFWKLKHEAKNIREGVNNKVFF